MDFPILLRVTVNGVEEQIPTHNIERFRNPETGVEVVLHSGNVYVVEESLDVVSLRFYEALQSPAEPVPA